MRVLRDGLPFGVYAAPVVAMAREVVLPALGGLVVGAFGAGWLIRKVVRG